MNLDHCLICDVSSRLYGYGKTVQCAVSRKWCVMAAVSCRNIA